MVAKKSIKEITEDDRDIKHKYKHRDSSIYESVKKSSHRLFVKGDGNFRVGLQYNASSLPYSIIQ